ncbi:hypothetical protein FACS1894107_13310 [Planctomycetales bacterium]|nr:hypothetical protein FACS1894107_13310 [Planctomycetales bacterium]
MLGEKVFGEKNIEDIKAYGNLKHLFISAFGMSNKYDEKDQYESKYLAIIGARFRNEQD